MIDLTINGMRAIPKKDTSIKLTLVNQYFDTSSSFSFDIELPLNIAENRRIFGNITRQDVAKSKIELPAVLSADNYDILIGTATISQVDEEVVKIQLLGEGKPSLSTIDENTFIDELDLGNWYTRYFSGGEDLKGSAYWLVDPIMKTLLLNSYDEWKNLLFNSACVSYPILNTEAETIVNEYCARKHGGITRFSHAFSTPDSASRNGKPQVKFAVQPFVWYMCKIIAEASGYTLNESDNYLYTNDFYRLIFIANANISIECNRCLPHWSISEWWEQIKKTFGVAVSFDNYNKTVKIYQRDNYIQSSRIFYADNVVDEYSVSIEDEHSADDITLQNVGFAENNHFAKESYLPDEVLDFARVEKFDDFDSFYEFISSKRLNEVLALDVIYEVGGRHYIWKVTSYPKGDVEELVEVNMLRNRIITENKDVDVELKFVPCSITTTEINVFDDQIDTSKGGYIDNKLGVVEVEVLSRPDRANFDWYTDENELRQKKSIKIAEWVFGEEEEEIPEKEETFDVCYIAIHNPNLGDTISSDWGNFLYPRAILHESATLNAKTHSTDFSIHSYKDKGYSLGINPIEGQRNLASETIGTIKLNIDTSIKYCFKFISDKIPNPNDTFIINNKKYLCDKLEVSFDDNGIDKLMTGYFFAIKD